MDLVIIAGRLKRLFVDSSTHWSNYSIKAVVTCWQCCAPVIFRLLGRLIDNLGIFGMDGWLDFCTWNRYSYE